MINKRLLIKNLLAHNDENTFFDVKQEIDINSEKGKSKFLKHTSALCNSNPRNNSYIIIGIEDKSKSIIGTNYIDDSVVQNLVVSHLFNPPTVKYENIIFPNLGKDKVIGLLSISPNNNRTGFSKNIWKIAEGAEFYRRGSMSIPMDDKFYLDSSNPETVKEIENFSKISYKQISDSLLNFINSWGKESNPQYKIFKEQFFLCYRGYPTDFKSEYFLSEVEIRLLNEDVSFFYSANKWVKIDFNDDEFNVMEYVFLGLNDGYELYPFEKKTWIFFDNGLYTIKTEFVLVPPKFPEEVINSVYSKTKEFEKKLRCGYRINSTEDCNEYDVHALNFLVCYFNGIISSKQDLISSGEYLDGGGAETRSECLTILEKWEQSMNRAEKM